MRLLTACLIVSAAALSVRAAPPPPQAVHLERAYAGWRDAASFKRISEYFNGKENTGGEIILRTHPAERGGYYFLARIANDGPAVPVKFVVHVVSPDSGTPKIFTFAQTLPAGTSLFDLGLTSADWPGKDTHAVAWRLDVEDATGTILASEKSYLWEKPANL
ncbi:MAG TPA: hypothetical protein VHD32_09220 [Candidatus Didemnitutus sp.]|nr:hypothetical protein [Candidatus Didemnitutus sp.]